MLRQLNTLSKLTTSSIKYAANNTAAYIGLTSSREDSISPSTQLTAYWISETQRGLVSFLCLYRMIITCNEKDAFFDDEFELAQTIFMQHHHESPFHAVGFALIAYVEAMLGFESEKIKIALERITAAELLSKQFIKKVRRRNSWHKFKLEDDIIEVVSFDSSSNSTSDHSNGSHHSSTTVVKPEIQYELLATNCMLMSSTIQFLRNSWLEYMKAAYKLRKAYKLYEQMFEALTGQKASEYASFIRKYKYTDNRKKKRPISAIDCIDEDFVIIENAIESGIFFSIGLFSLVFSLLPPKSKHIHRNIYLF